MHIHYVLVVVCIAPNLGQQLAAREDPSRITGQGQQQIVFARGQPQRVATTRDLVPGRVDHQIIEDQGCQLFRRSRPGCARAGPAQHSFDSRHQLPRTEGLGQVIVRPDRQADDLINLLGPRGQHQHIGVRESAQPAAHLDAVEAG